MARPATFTADEIQKIFWDLTVELGRPPTHAEVRLRLNAHHPGNSLSNTTLTNALVPVKQAWLQQQQDALLGGPDPLEARWIAIFRAIKGRAERDAQAINSITNQSLAQAHAETQQMSNEADRLVGEYRQVMDAYRQLYTELQLLEQRCQNEAASAKRQLADLAKERDDARALAVAEKQRADTAEHNAKAWEGQAKTLTGERDAQRMRADGAEKRLRDAYHAIQQLKIDKATAEQKEQSAEQRRQDAVERAKELSEELKHLRRQVAGEGSELHRLREEAPQLRSSNAVMAQELGRASQHLSELMEHVLAVVQAIGEQAANKQWQPVIDELRSQISQINTVIGHIQPAEADLSVNPSATDGRAPGPPLGAG